MTGSLTHDLAAMAVDLTKAVLARRETAYTASDACSVYAEVFNSVRDTIYPPDVQAPKPEPRVPIKKTITPDAIISLEDGRSYKSLKRHLAGRGLTPEQYREKWGLAADYPMTAPNYALRRAEIARATGLGRKKGV